MFIDADQVQKGMKVVLGGACRTVEEVRLQGRATLIKFQGEVGYNQLGFCEPVQVVSTPA